MRKAVECGGLLAAQGGGVPVHAGKHFFCRGAVMRVARLLALQVLPQQPGRLASVGEGRPLAGRLLAGCLLAGCLRLAGCLAGSPHGGRRRVVFVVRLLHLAALHGGAVRPPDHVVLGGSARIGALTAGVQLQLQRHIEPPQDLVPLLRDVPGLAGVKERHVPRPARTLERAHRIQCRLGNADGGSVVK